MKQVYACWLIAIILLVGAIPNTAHASKVGTYKAHLYLVDDNNKRIATKTYTFNKNRTNWVKAPVVKGYQLYSPGVTGVRFSVHAANQTIRYDKILTYQWQDIRQQMLNQVNKYRSWSGARAVHLTRSQTNLANSRAHRAYYQYGAILPPNHFWTSNEVVLNTWRSMSGSSMVSAWYNENIGGNRMAGAPGHRNWIIDRNATAIGFGQVRKNGALVTVGRSN